MDIETKLRNQLEYLYTMLDKYQELNHKTKGKYGYRQEAIECEIDSLENILCQSAIDTSWNNCYEEDSRGVE